MGKDATINEGGYSARPYAPTRTLTPTNVPEVDRSLEEIVRETQQSLRRRKKPRTQRLDSPRKRLVAHRPRRKRCEYGVGLEPDGMWRKGLEVQQVLDGGKQFVVWGWPTPIRAGARTDLPPDPGKPTYGPASREEARKLLREAKQAKVNLGPITKGNLFKVIRNYVWAPILRRAGLRYRKPHALRHTYASLLIEGGESLEYVQEQLGHHSPAFTLAVYGHLIPRGDRRAVDRWTTHPPAIPRNQAARVWVVSELAL
jgi:integrase